MPVRGLRKYLAAVSKLFHASLSHCTLIAIDVVDDGNAIVARWRLEGVLRLPWRPSIKPFLGSTRYELEPETGLIVGHVEEWSISALDAFVSTVIPSFGAPPAAAVAPLALDRRLSDRDTDHAVTATVK